MAFNPVTWRKSHGVLGYLYVHRPAVVFKARLDNPDGTIYPTQELNYDTVTVGDWEDVVLGMTVLIGSTEGAYDLGRQRVKFVNSTTIYTGWSSIGEHDGEMILPNNAYLTVIDEHLVWGKTPFISILTGDQWKDFDVGFNDAIVQPPVANGGVGYAQFVDPITEVITVEFDSANSFANHPGNIIISQTWDVGDGTITVGIDSDVAITAEFPPGFRYVKLTVQDGGSRTHTTYIPVFAAERTGDNAPFNVDAQLQISAEGTKATFNLKEDATTTEYPDGTLVMFWVEEYYDGVLGSLAGQTGREHMRFIGFIHNEPTSISAGENIAERKTTLECLDVAGKLATLPGFPQAIRRVAGATNWYEMQSANVDRFLHYLLHWHSTALELTDFYNSGTGDTYAFGSFSSDGATLYTQVDGRAQATGTGYRFTSDSQGILRLVLDPQYQETGDRTSTVIVALTEDDLTDYSYRKQRPPRVHWIRASAIKVTTAELTPQDIVWAIAPGAAPGQGESAQEIGNRLVVTQAQLNTFLGNYYARQNAPESQLDTTLTHGGFAGIEPALMEWVTLTTTAANAPHRGLVFTEERFLPLSVTLNFDSDKGTCEQSLTLEREIVGQAASVYVPPTANLPGYVDPSEYFGEVLDMVDTGFAGQATFGAFASDGNLYLTGDFGTQGASGGATWEQVVLGVTGEVSGFTVDAYSPKYLGTGNTVDGWLVTYAVDAVRIYHLIDIFDVSARAVNLVFTSATVPYDLAYIASERITQNAVIVTWYSVGSGAMCAYTTDGTTFTESNISPFEQASLFTFTVTPTITVVGAGVAYASAFTANGSNNAAAGYVFKTLDGGATWAQSNGSTLAALGFTLHMPFADNPARNKYWFTQRSFGSPDEVRAIYYDGSTENDLSPVYAGDKVALTAFNKSLATNPTNSQQVFLCGSDHNGNRSVHKSVNGGDDWTFIDSGDFTRLRGCDVNDRGDVYVWGDDFDIGFVANFGDVIDDRRGNLLTDFTPARIIAIAGG